MNRAAGARPQRGESTGRFQRQHREALRAAFARLRERPLSHGFALALLTLAMLSLLLLRLGLEQFDRFGSPLAGARTLSLFLASDVDEVRARALAVEFAADPRVADVLAISPAEGLRELVHLDGSDEALAALPDDPLPWVLAVEPRTHDDGVALRSAWKQRADIDHIVDESEWRRQADAVMTAARAVIMTLMLLVAAATILIAANAVRTIRVEGSQERDLQRVFGASEADLRRPYVYLGLLYGVIAALLAVLLALAICLALRPVFAPIAEMFELADAGARRGWWRLVVVPAAALLGAFGAWLGCRFERDVEIAE
jgi:cell division transport system permease protein